MLIYKKSIKRKCLTCKKIFKCYFSHIKRGQGKFCSRKCLSAYYGPLFSKSRIGSNNPNWKGNKVGYDALHQRIKKHFPKRKLCQNCKLYSPYDLANISQKYKRNINDWEWLCRRCHMTKDGRMTKFLSYRKPFDKHI